ncbi:MAG: amidohydrolase [Fusobacteria bacterium]|nr:amidohydrolase [Fusobacteriota bacterium]
MGYLFKDVKMVSMNDDLPEIYQGDLLVEGKYISKISQNIPKSAHKVIEGKNLLIMPGFINTHTHVSMSLMRSYGDDMELFDWLHNRIWPVEARLSKEDVYWGAILGIAEMLLSGTTTFLDMYQDMEMVAKAVLDTGIRGDLSRGTIFTGNQDKDDSALENLIDLIENFHNKAEDRLRILAGPHAVYTNNKDFLLKQVSIAKKYNTGINIHVSETTKENEDCLKEHGMTPVEYLNSIGLFEAPYTIAAHMVHLSDNDIKLVKANDIGIAHNPKSNLKLGSGIANINTYIREDLKVAIGTDGAASNNALDMLSELQYASLLQKGINSDPMAIKAYEALKLGTFDGSVVLKRENQIGMLKEGYEADIIMFDLNQPHFYPLENSPVANLVYSSKSTDIIMTMVQGKILMQNRKLLTIDLEKVYCKIKDIINRIYSDEVN